MTHLSLFLYKYEFYKSNNYLQSLNSSDLQKSRLCALKIKALKRQTSCCTLYKLIMLNRSLE